MRNLVPTTWMCLGVAAALVASFATGAGPAVAQEAPGVGLNKKAVPHRTGRPAHHPRQRAVDTAPKAPASTTIPLDLTDMNRGVSGYGDPRTRPAEGPSEDQGSVRPTLGNGLTPGAAFAF